MVRRDKSCSRGRATTSRTRECLWMCPSNQELSGPKWHINLQFLVLQTGKWWNMNIRWVLKNTWQVGPRQPTYVSRAWCIFESYAAALDFDPFGRESRGFWVKLGVPGIFPLHWHDSHMILTWSEYVTRRFWIILTLPCDTIPEPCDIAANEVLWFLMCVVARERS